MRPKMLRILRDGLIALLRMRLKDICAVSKFGFAALTLMSDFRSNVQLQRHLSGTTIEEAPKPPSGRSAVESRSDRIIKL